MTQMNNERETGEERAIPVKTYAVAVYSRSETASAASPPETAGWIRLG